MTQSKHSACEYDNLPSTSPQKQAIIRFKKAAMFIMEEIIACEEMLAKLTNSSDSGDDWSESYFELKTEGNQYNVRLFIFQFLNSNLISS